jgi:predicted metal-dependent phosphoesterase TrpH
MRCDLHVHTYHSGMCTVPLLDRVCKESYTSPEEAYEKLKRLGMDLVTVTDHDSIGAAGELRRHPDFFVSEEVSVVLPGGTRAHIGVYDINERQHIELQRRAADTESLLAFLDEQGLFFSVNHVFSSLTGPRTFADFELFASRFPALETRNAAMLACANAAAAELASRWRKAPVGGSDAHALHSVGRAFTEVAGARNKQEFFAGLRAGHGVVHGGHGSWALLIAEVLSIVASLLREKPAAALLTPLLAFLPLVLAVNYGKEAAFAALWQQRLRAAGGQPALEAAG